MNLLENDLKFFTICKCARSFIVQFAQIVKFLVL